MGIMDYIQDAFKSNLRRSLSGIGEDLERTLYRGTRRLIRRFVKEMMSMMLILVSIIFLAVGAVYFFIEYVQLNKTISFLIIGVVILLIGLIIRLNR
jgi:hypothetical protein